MQLLMRRPEIRGFISISRARQYVRFQLPRALPRQRYLHPGRGRTRWFSPTAVQKLVDKLRTQKHITIHHDEIPRANHFFENEQDELMKSVKSYLDFRLDPSCPIS